MLAAVAGAVLLALAGGGALLSGALDDTGADPAAGATPAARTSAPAATTAPASPTPPPAATTPASPTASPTPSPTPAAPTPTTPAPTPTPQDDEGEGEGGAVPAGFTTYTDPVGYSIARPDGWTISRNGPRVDLRDPTTGRFVRIDSTDEPKSNPEADWRNQEISVRQRLPGYERISIDTVDYRDYPAADWQFRFNGSNGKVRVISRGFVAQGRGYAIYWSTADSRWEEDLDYFATFTESFRPA